MKSTGRHRIAEACAAGRAYVTMVETEQGYVLMRHRSAEELRGLLAGMLATGRKESRVQQLSGKITDRIRRGEIDADPLAPRVCTDDRPQPDSVRHGAGRALGDASRSDPSAAWRDPE